MSIRVTVNSIEKNRVSINADKRRTIRTVNVQPNPTGTSFQDLTGIDANNAKNNDTLVYDELRDVFVAKQLPILNGGTF